MKRTIIMVCISILSAGFAANALAQYNDYDYDSNFDRMVNDLNDNLYDTYDSLSENIGTNWRDIVNRAEIVTDGLEGHFDRLFQGLDEAFDEFDNGYTRGSGQRIPCTYGCGNQ